MAAEVSAVNYESRELTLTGEGGSVTFFASPDVRNLARPCHLGLRRVIRRACVDYGWAQDPGDTRYRSSGRGRTVPHERHGHRVYERQPQRPPARSALQTRLRLGDHVDYVLPGATGGRARPSEIRDAATGAILRPG